ncbi:MULTISPECIES: GNAT family N-acetyltransferase [unclassified Beijerinckia]|uniref:GNAT family N-acetyltransferase n=1 Tax=unclassified Beijerinckia TaxID=2638183 RepID=UPI0008971343|nr:MULTISPECIES: GNAT family N-acetyltransferase [unclassified Beijerinckia]MDH7794489.1 GNAT superfamily N-acetyltransferase [Beijerinckia sp. GAS462]SEB64109.1 Ribosomal protein S18 acetylase RimI [Beijerinckia sp. 28-YEA-48]
MQIRPPIPQDEARWRQLWAGYTSFYRAEVSEAVTADLWARLLHGDGPVRGLVADAEGEGLIGFATFLFHPSTWSLQPSCYLEDLFVDPQARGSGAGKGLILAVEAAAKEAGAFRLYWHTQEFNAPARSLYDTLVNRSSFIVYRKAL